MDSTAKIEAMEKKIEGLQRQVAIILAMNALSLLLTIVKLFIMTAPEAEKGQPPSNTNSVNISEHAATAPQRDYLTTDEVAQREGVTTRTVTTWIDAARFDPQPERNGRAWRISNSYRLLPQIADNCGN